MEIKQSKHLDVGRYRPILALQHWLIPADFGRSWYLDVGRSQHFDVARFWPILAPRWIYILKIFVQSIVGGTCHALRRNWKTWVPVATLIFSVSPLTPRKFPTAHRFSRMFWRKKAWKHAHIFPASDRIPTHTNTPLFSLDGLFVQSGRLKIQDIVGLQRVCKMHKIISGKKGGSVTLSLGNKCCSSRHRTQKSVL